MDGWMDMDTIGVLKDSYRGDEANCIRLRRLDAETQQQRTLYQSNKSQIVIDHEYCNL